MIKKVLVNIDMDVNADAGQYEQDMAEGLLQNAMAFYCSQGGMRVRSAIVKVGSGSARYVHDNPVYLSIAGADNGGDAA